VVLIEHLDSLLQYLVFTRADGTWAAQLDPGDYNLEYHVLTPGYYELPTAGQSTFTLGAGQNLTLNGTAQVLAFPEQSVTVTVTACVPGPSTVPSPSTTGRAEVVRASTSSGCPWRGRRT
jgi:hypothetical protein